MLSRHDLLAALHCVQRIMETSDHDEFVETLIRVMQALMQAKVTAYNEADPVRQRFAFVVRPREVVSDSMIRAWVKHARENPLLEHAINNPTDFTVHKITDFMPHPQFCRSTLCRQTYRKMGAEYQIAMPFPATGSAAIAIVFNRDYDFTERDREILTLLQPLIVSVYRNVQRFYDLEQKIGDAEKPVVAAAEDNAAIPQSLGLSPRKMDVLTHLLKGKSNSEIADALGLSIRTVEKHVEHLLKKLDVPNRAAACAKFRNIQLQNSEK